MIFKSKMLATTVITLMSLETSLAFFYPADCNSKCECNGTTIICTGTAIPELDKRHTIFAIQDVEPRITTLDTTITANLDHVISLQINSAGFKAIEEGALGMIKNLKHLEITDNDIKILEDLTFENCTQIVYLNLENNNIEIIDDQAFNSLNALENISLAHNALKTLPSYFPPKIARLSIEDNQIQEIRNFGFDKLTALNLCNTNISSTINIKTEMTHLTELCLGSPYLRLEQNTLNHDKFPSLQNLRLAGNNQSRLNISSPVKDEILQMTSESLNVLVMEFCRLDNLNFSNANSKLKEIRLSNVTHVPFQKISSKITLPPVKIFDLSGSENLARLFLFKHTKEPMLELEVLRMSRCGIKRISELMLVEKAPNLKRLDLSHNPLHCTCSGLSWIKKYVFDDRLSLIMEENTLCASPEHLQGIPLLTATMCPRNDSILKIITPHPTNSPTTGFTSQDTSNMPSTTMTMDDDSSNSTSTDIPPTLDNQERDASALTALYIIIPIILFLGIFGVVKYCYEQKHSI